jgi:membrane fusion protein (multidrug efflux system)
MTQNKEKRYFKMKARIISAMMLVALIAVSCAEQDSLEAKKAALTEAKANMKSLQKEIKALEEEIIKVEPDFGKSAVKSTLVTTVPAERIPFEHKVDIRGNVLSRTNVNISSEMMGQLLQVHVVEGQKVNKGDLIAEIDSENLRKNIKELNTQIEYATTIYQKRARLWDKNIGTEVEYLQAKNTKESLENQLETLMTQLDKSTIEAPFSGTIENVPVKSGELMQPGQPVAFLVSNNNMYIRAEVSEDFIGSFNVGDEVEVTFPSLKKTVKTKINAIGNVINPASRTFTVEVNLPDELEYLKTNLVAILRLTDYRSADAVVIPSRIIQEDTEGNFIYTVQNQQARKVHVQLGYSYDNQTEVLLGLMGGETIIDKGNRSVADGTVVSIQN